MPVRPAWGLLFDRATVPPYREQEFAEPCAECEERSKLRCARCARPLCALHDPGAAARCAACEEEHQALAMWRLGPRPASFQPPRAKLLVVAAAGQLIAGVESFLGGRWLFAALMLFAGSLTASAFSHPGWERRLLWDWKRRRFRKRFLKERLRELPPARASRAPRLRPASAEREVPFESG